MGARACDGSNAPGIVCTVRATGPESVYTTFERVCLWCGWRQTCIADYQPGLLERVPLHWLDGTVDKLPEVW